MTTLNRFPDLTEVHFSEGSRPAPGATFIVITISPWFVTVVTAYIIIITTTIVIIIIIIVIVISEGGMIRLETHIVLEFHDSSF